LSEEEREKAVALRYDPEFHDAPVVVAKGQGELAERIIRLASENKVVIRQDRELVNYLYALDLYEEIPPELYGIVAEVLAFVYGLDKKGRTFK